MYYRELYALCIFVIFVNTSIAQNNSETTLFQECAKQYESQPINMLWQGRFSWIESTRSPDVIEAVFTLLGEPLEWDATNGAHFPDGLQSIQNGTETIGVTLSDGTVVRFIFDGWHNGRYYGWLTDSTQMYASSYNPQPNPHVRCGFWSVKDDDINQIRELFDEYTTQEAFNPSYR